jgi:hypothetical protein
MRILCCWYCYRMTGKGCLSEESRSGVKEKESFRQVVKKGKDARGCKRNNRWIHRIRSSIVGRSGARA